MRSRSLGLVIALTSVPVLGALAVTPSPAQQTRPAEPEQAPAGSAASAASAAEAADEGSAPAAGLTGVLSEEAFKKLHQLKGEAAPEPKGEAIEIAGADCYLSLPEGARPPLPGLVVIHEWWGLNEHVKHWADRLAEAGYAALAVDLYGGTVATTTDGAMNAMKAVEEERALEILLAAHEELATNRRIRAERRGSIGWCFGGGWSLQLAMNAPEQDATVVYYGRLVNDPDELSTIGGSLLGVFGTQDRGIPPAMVDGFEDGLDRAVVPHVLLRYDAQHAFANPSSGRYDQRSAAQAWVAVQRFLEKEMRDR